jgi:S-adenosylmethionine:tRNA ribosyltransferase-isomerase
MSTAAPERAPSVLDRVLRERREAHEPPEARGLRRDEVRMLVAAPARDGTNLRHAQARDLPDYLRAGDVLVVNTSATLPAALPARRADGTALRLHLSTPAAGNDGMPAAAKDAAALDAPEDGATSLAGGARLAPADPSPVGRRAAPADGARWIVELRRGTERFGGGRAGETLSLPGGARATLLAPYLGGSRLWLAAIDTDGAALHDCLARHGAPIRYAHTTGEHPLADYQTAFALHPGSAEMPSAGRPFTPALVTALVTRGITVAPLVLHAGVSSLEAGEAPYPERFSVPAPTARLVNAARAGGGRVIAVGTTVVRALETVALPFGHVEADSGWTRHVVTPACGVRVVDGLLTGWHDPDASHLQLLEAVGGRALIEDSYAAALEHGYRWHEFGDVHLILPAS